MKPTWYFQTKKNDKNTIVLDLKDLIWKDLTFRAKDLVVFPISWTCSSEKVLGEEVLAPGSQVPRVDQEGEEEGERYYRVGELCIDQDLRKASIELP